MSSAPALPTEPANALDVEFGSVQQTNRESPVFLHSPPDSNNAHNPDATDSELSDLDEEPALPDNHQSHQSSSPPHDADKASSPAKDGVGGVLQDEDIGEVLPDHWSGAVAVFKPTMHQFKDFKRFMEKVNSYGMKSGIIKIIPPAEWKDKQPRLDELVKGVRVREPIKQDIMGSNGTYRQVNILHGRSYNVPQWRQLCDQSEHQPPARRGERRANAEKPKPQRKPAATNPTKDPLTPRKRGKKPGRRRGRPGRKAPDDDRPMTPVSPRPEELETEEGDDDIVNTVEGDSDAPDASAPPGRMGAVRQAKTKTQSVSARRKFSRREGSAMIDEAAFRDFDYQMDISDYTPERCEELERAYWKTLTYAPPLYGADMMGTLFDERTEIWNLNKLPNLLDVLGTKIPGVNTAYLYFGMWKATFAWHLEDVDLYSINYVHFGAPKQWYSISQADARRFEAAMKNIWPADAKACNQFLRHKGYLISPQHLLQNYGIKVNKVVSYPGEFVVTYPYGYHSGYNLGYNCAEAVNFALEPWLEMGKIAKRCECAQAQDSVWINVYEIERKLRGEDTEYEETEEEDEDEDDDEEEEGQHSGLPSPPSSHGVKTKAPPRKRKRALDEKPPKVKVKKIKLRLKARAEPPCALCPNDVSTMELLPTDDGRRAHRVCALYLPETYIDEVDGHEVVSNVSGVCKDRTELKCLYCRSKRGACFQCSHNKCTRSYHATCAAAAGVFVEEAEVPVFGEDQTEYKEQAFEFSCRFHRSKREKKLDGDALEDDTRIQETARKAKKGDVCQFQYHKGDIFAGVVVANQADDHTLLINILPHGERLEVEWKWLRLPDPSDYHLPRASPNAIPLPSSRKAKEKLNAKRSTDDKPRKDDPFTDSTTWAEFNLHNVERNSDQVNVDFSKTEQIWHYLPRKSTDTKDRYTDDPSKRVHNPRSNFMGTVPKPVKPAKPKSASFVKPPPPQPQPQQFLQSPAPSLPANATHTGPMPATQTPWGTEQLFRYRSQDATVPKPDESSMYTQQRFIMLQPGAETSHIQPKEHHHSGQVSGGHSQQQAEARSLATESGQLRNMHQPVSVTHLNSTKFHAPMAAAQHIIPAQCAQSNHCTQPPQHAQQAPQAQEPQQAQQAQQHTQQHQGLPNPGTPVHAYVRQGHKPSWQIHAQIYQKYPFFQVHHNRDASKYRTPYAPWGGFTNGYEGDLRAHLLANSNELLRRSSFSSRRLSNSGYPSACASYAGHRGGQAVGSPATSVTPEGTPVNCHMSHVQTPPPLAASKKNGGKSSDAVPQRAASQSSTAKQKPTPAPKSYKIPPKQSPVPLPANFLAAMTASQGLMSLSSKPPSSVSEKPCINAIEQQKDQKNAIPTLSPSRGSQLSVSHTSIPKFPGLTPHQAAAKESVAGLSSTALQSNATLTLSGIHPTSKRVSFASAELCPGEGDPVVEQNPGTFPSAVCSAPQEFPDVPGSESMEFMEAMMANLRRVVRSDE